MEVTITGLERTLYTEPTAQGHIILAYFSAKVSVFSLKGCCLVRTNRGDIDVWLPNLTDKKKRQHCIVTLDDKPTKRALQQAALKAFRIMGGSEADYQSRDEDDDDLIARPPAIELPSEMPPAIQSTMAPTRRPLAIKRRIERVETGE